MPEIAIKCNKEHIFDDIFLYYGPVCLPDITSSDLYPFTVIHIFLLLFYPFFFTYFHSIEFCVAKQ